MNKVRMILAVLIIAILQVSVFPLIEIFGVHPNAAIGMLVALSMGFGSYAGGFSGLWVGLFEDILYAKYIGLRALIYFSLGFLLGNKEFRISLNDNKIGMVYTIIFTVVNYIIILATSFNTENFSVALAYLKGGLFIELILNCIVYYFIMKVFRKILVFPNVRFY